MAQDNDTHVAVTTVAAWRWMKRDEMAKALNTSTRTIHRKVKSGEILRRKMPDVTLYKLAPKSTDTPLTTGDKSGDTSDVTSATMSPSDTTATQNDTVNDKTDVARDRRELITAAMNIARSATAQTQTLAELLRQEKEARNIERAERLRWQAVALKLLGLEG